MLQEILPLSRMGRHEGDGGIFRDHGFHLLLLLRHRVVAHHHAVFSCQREDLLQSLAGKIHSRLRPAVHIGNQLTDQAEAVLMHPFHRFQGLLHERGVNVKTGRIEIPVFFLHMKRPFIQQAELFKAPPRIKGLPA